MKELRQIRSYVGSLASIHTVSRAGTVRMSTEHLGVIHRGAGLTLTQASARLLESLQGYPKARTAK